MFLDCLLELSRVLPTQMYGIALVIKRSCDGSNERVVVEKKERLDGG